MSRCFKCHRVVIDRAGTEVDVAVIRSSAFKNTGIDLRAQDSGEERSRLQLFHERQAQLVRSYRCARRRSLGSICNNNIRDSSSNVRSPTRLIAFYMGHRQYPLDLMLILLYTRLVMAFGSFNLADQLGAGHALFPLRSTQKRIDRIFEIRRRINQPHLFLEHAAGVHVFGVPADSLAEFQHRNPFVAKAHRL